MTNVANVLRPLEENSQVKTYIPIKMGKESC